MRNGAWRYLARVEAYVVNEILVYYDQILILFIRRVSHVLITIIGPIT